MKIRNQKDFFSGLLFIAIGAFFAVFSRKYDIGTAKEIGPGYFPLILGIVLIFLGLIVSVKSLIAHGEKVGLDMWHWRPILLLSMAIIGFAFAMPTMGFLIAVAILVAVSIFAYSGNRSLKEIFLVTVGFTTFAWLIFVVGLGLNLQVLPSIFIKGM